MCENKITEAAKELASYAWDQDEEWDFLEETESTDPKSSILFYAAEILDDMNSYLETFYIANKNIETRVICMDCFYEMFQENPGDFFQLFYGDESEKIQERHREFVDKMCDNFKHTEDIEQLRNDFSLEPCDCCGSKLHGERYWVNLYK